MSDATLRILTPEEFLAWPREATWDFTVYKELLNWLDRTTGVLHERLGAHYHCHKGCHHCCRRIATLFPVEWLHALVGHDMPDVGMLESGLHPGEPLCSLLDAQGCCRIYERRPLICRTHGHVLLLPPQAEEERAVDACPWNFTELEELDEELILDLDRLHHALFAAHLAFLKASYPATWKDLVHVRLAFQSTP